MPQLRIRIARPLIFAFGALLTLSPVAMAVREYLTPGGHTYTTAVVARGEVASTVSAKGVLQAREQADVGSQVSGRLKSLKVKLGEHVKQGQAVAEIEPLPLRNALLGAQTSLESLEAQQRAVSANMWRAKLALDRQQQMMAHEATSQQELESAKAQADVLQADLGSLHARIEEARAQVDTARGNLESTRITAPIDGVVVAIGTQEGRNVAAAPQGPVIVKLADLDHMTVRAQISENDVLRIRPGQPVWFTIPGDPDVRHAGALGSVEMAPLEFGNGDAKPDAPVYYSALFDAPNADHQLRIGMTAQVTVVLADQRDALLAPLSALGARMQDGRFAVRVLRADGTTSTVPVRVGIADRQHVQVLDGLKEFDQVVTADGRGV